MVFRVTDTFEDYWFEQQMITRARRAEHLLEMEKINTEPTPVTEAQPPMVVKEIIEPATSDKTEPRIVVLEKKQCSCPFEKALERNGVASSFSAFRDGVPLVDPLDCKNLFRPVNILNDPIQPEGASIKTQEWSGTKAIMEPQNYFKGVWAMVAAMKLDDGILQDLPFRCVFDKDTVLEMVVDPLPKLDPAHRPSRILNRKENKATSILKQLYKEFDQIRNRLRYIQDCHAAGHLPDMGQKPLKVWSLPGDSSYPDWLVKTLENETKNLYKSYASIQALGLSVALEHMGEKIKVIKTFIFQEFGMEVAKDICTLALDFNRQPRKCPKTNPPLFEFSNSKQEQSREGSTFDSLVKLWQQVLEVEDTERSIPQQQPNPGVTQQVPEIVQDLLPEVTWAGNPPDPTDLATIAKTLKVLVEKVARLEAGKPTEDKGVINKKPRRNKKKQKKNTENRGENTKSNTGTKAENIRTKEVESKQGTYEKQKNGYRNYNQKNTGPQKKPYNNYYKNNYRNNYRNNNRRNFYGNWNGSWGGPQGYGNNMDQNWRDPNQPFQNPYG